MKTMTIDELKERELHSGDLFFNTSGNSEFTGWYLMVGEHAISLNAENEFAWLSNPMQTVERLQVTKIITKLDLANANLSSVAQFFRTFNELSIRPFITEITYKQLAKYVHAVHFGSTKLYTWRVPERLSRVDFKPGDIFEVDTMYGNQYVQVKEVSEHDYYGEFKEVINLIKADEIPF